MIIIIIINYLKGFLINRMGFELIGLAEDRYDLPALLNTVMNIQFHKMRGISSIT
jgi:hypothetical protein